MATIDMHQVVGRANILFITFDCLRFDVARRCLAEGTTPQLARLLPADGWEPRETPGTFTLAAHLAFFHGFLPTPLGDATHPRLFALEFEGSLTIGPGTYTFAGVDNILAGFRRLGYRTFCVGGVGFFNKRQVEGANGRSAQDCVCAPSTPSTGRDDTGCNTPARTAGQSPSRPPRRRT